MRAYWTGFAKDGIPAGAGLKPWPAFHQSGQQMISLSPTSTTISRDFAFQHKCGFWSGRSRPQPAGL